MDSIDNGLEISGTCLWLCPKCLLGLVDNHRFDDAAHQNTRKGIHLKRYKKKNRFIIIGIELFSRPLLANTIMISEYWILFANSVYYYCSGSFISLSSIEIDHDLCRHEIFTRNVYFTISSEWFNSWRYINSIADTTDPFQCTIWRSEPKTKKHIKLAKRSFSCWI